MVRMTTVDNNEVNNSLFQSKGDEPELLMEDNVRSRQPTHNTCLQSFPDPITDLNTNIQITYGIPNLNRNENYNIPQIHSCVFVGTKHN